MSSTARTARALAALAALMGVVCGLLACGAVTRPASTEAATGAVGAAVVPGPSEAAVPGGSGAAAPGASEAVVPGGSGPVVPVAAETVLPAAAERVVPVEAGAGPGPGCGEGHPGDGAARPATPPRPNGFADLLPTLAGARAADGFCGADQVIRELLPGPEPPELVPPSPVELSILRV